MPALEKIPYEFPVIERNGTGSHDLERFMAFTRYEHSIDLFGRCQGDFDSLAAIGYPLVDDP